MEKLLKIVEKICPKFSAEMLYPFLAGIICCLGLILLVLILWGILRLLCCHERKIPGISLQTDHGSLFIATAAVADLIRSLESGFPDLKIMKVRLLSIKKELCIQVKVLYAPGGQSMLTLTDDFQKRALALLKESFGIENIRRIDLVVPKGRH